MSMIRSSEEKEKVNAATGKSPPVNRRGNYTVPEGVEAKILQEEQTPYSLIVVLVATVCLLHDLTSTHIPHTHKAHECISIYPSL